MGMTVLPGSPGVAFQATEEYNFCSIQIKQQNS